MEITEIDSEFMGYALGEAEKAGQNNEVPIGSVIVAKTGEIISKAQNMTICLSDPTAHAEMLAIRKAAYFIGNYRLLEATLYTTIEPCIMCMGAIIHARLKRVVFGAYDNKWGGVGSLYDFSKDERLNHSVVVTPGIREEECRDLIQNFFRNKRSMGSGKIVSFPGFEKN
jgi:tRNA(adenine34) deaminase